MLATILKSPQATETTLAIIETYAKLKQFVNAIQKIRVDDTETKKEAILLKGSELFSEIISDELKMDETETTIELNLALLKLKHTVKRKKKE
jgi:hypothetical protein